MLKTKFNYLLILSFVLILQPLISPESQAWARRRSPPKAFSFIAEGGKASQGECDGERKIPRKLKRVAEFAKISSYMGSELQSPEIPGKANEEMWKHFYRVKSSCNTALAKTPSAKAAAASETKPELPPEELDEPTSEDEPASETAEPE